jgi:UDP-glucuronate 4-epimerase
MGTILITGGAGFIGSHLADRLLGDGRTVVALDNFDPFYDPGMKRRNVEEASRHADYRLIEGDIRDEACLESIFSAERIDAVVHLAARAGVRPSISDPVGYTSVNVDGTVKLLEACRLHGVGRFLFGSSSSVYGNNAEVPFAEHHPVDHPISPYAASKKAGEVLCHAHHHLHGIRVACLRFFTVYGPRQRPDLAIRKFAEAILGGEPIDRFGDGSAARDYTFVTDIVDGIVRALDRTTGYHVWNLGGSEPLSLADLISKIAGILGEEPEVRERPPQPGDVERTWADIRRARGDLDWTPRVGIDEGLRSFVDWLRKEPATSAGPEKAK